MSRFQANEESATFPFVKMGNGKGVANKISASETEMIKSDSGSPFASDKRLTFEIDLSFR